MPQIVQLDSDDDEFEDASESFNVDDEYFVDNDNSSRKQEPLSKPALYIWCKAIIFWLYF